MRPPITTSPAAAVAFCATSPSACVLTVWPSGTGELNSVREWLDSTGACLVYEAAVPLTTQTAELASILALYDGEEWLESNCWYMEQPLETGPPTGPCAGAKWKHALCFRNDHSRHPQALVVDVSTATTSLWRAKYTIRCSLAEQSGNPGNSCMHLTDEQSDATLVAYRAGHRQSNSGMACDGSFAYTCARALLHPASLDWLNSRDLQGMGLGSAEFRQAWGRYTAWLHEPPAGDVDEGFVPAPLTFLE